jgi:hypothetical protein
MYAEITLNINRIILHFLVFFSHHSLNFVARLRNGLLFFGGGGQFFVPVFGSSGRLVMHNIEKSNFFCIGASEFDCCSDSIYLLST